MGCARQDERIDQKRETEVLNRNGNVAMKLKWVFFKRYLSPVALTACLVLSVVPVANLQAQTSTKPTQ